MTITIWDNPASGPRWNGIGQYFKHIPRNKRQEEIEKFCTVYPVWFFELLTEVKEGVPTEFYPFQIDFLNDQSRFRISNKTRQAGGSLVLSADKFWKAYTQYDYKCAIMSVSRTEAQDKIRYIRNFYLSLPLRWRTTKLAADNAESISFHGGKRISTIRSVAASASVRGGNKDLVFDEAAHIPKLDDIYTAALPAASRSTEDAQLGMDLVSTPNGKQGKFWELFTSQNEDSKFSKHEFGWWDVPVFCKDIDAAKRKWETEYDKEPSNLILLREEFATKDFMDIAQELTEEEYLQEYCGIFVDEAASYFSFKLIDDCRKHNEPQHDGDKDWYDLWDRRPADNGSDVFMGIDFAEGKKGGDSTAVYIVEVEPKTGIYYVRKWEDLDYETGHRTFEDQLQRIGELIYAYRPTVVRMDATGLGTKLAADVEDRFGAATTVEHVVFHNAIKEEMALNLKGMMEDSLLKLPFEDKKLRNQMHAVTRKITPNGNITYAGDPHDDKFWALALACKGSRKSKFSIIPIFGDE